jgi:hypothetical protein
MGGNDAADEHRFATAARVSETNLALYRTFAQPIVRALVSPLSAHWLQQLHPLRLQYEMFSDANPMMASVAAMADQVSKDRSPVAGDNPYVALQKEASRRIVAALDAWRDANELLAEKWFLMVYGSPTLQAAAGLDRTLTSRCRRKRRAGSSPPLTRGATQTSSWLRNGSSWYTVRRQYRRPPALTGLRRAPRERR